MRSRVAYFILAFVVILTHNIILGVSGQPTAHGCENGDASVDIIVEIQQLFEATYRRQNDQVQQMHELHNAWFQEMRRQLDAVKTSLQEGDRRTQNLNVSFQQMKNQLDRVVTSLQALETDLEERTVPPPTVNNWTILMHRFDGSVNFGRSWVEYRNGFGDIGRGEFWLGNEKIHRLTNRIGVVHTLRIETQKELLQGTVKHLVYGAVKPPPSSTTAGNTLRMYSSKFPHNTSGQWYYADYYTFSTDSESNKYTLHLSGFSGNAGDSLTNTSSRSGTFLDGMHFSTFDADNDRGDWTSNFAMSHVGGGGWWFNACQYACLTCSYNSAQGFRWYSLRHLSSDRSGKLRAASMMIKSK